MVPSVTPGSKPVSSPLSEEKESSAASSSVLVPAASASPSSSNSSWRWSSYLPDTSRLNPAYLFSRNGTDQPTRQENLSPLGRVLIKTEMQKVLPLLCQFYGEKVVSRAILRYKVQLESPLSPAQAAAFLYGIGAMLDEEVAAQLFFRLKSISLEDFRALGLSDETYASLSSMVEAVNFSEMDDQQIDLLMGALQAPIQQQISEEQAKELVKEIADLNVAQAFHEDYQIFRRCTQQQEFNSEEYPESAQAEFWSRKPPYAVLKEGMLIAGRNLETDGPIYYKVVDGVDKEGFGMFLLQGVAPQNRNQVMLLFRGTDPSNIDSLRGNLGRASGLGPFLKNEQNIFAMLQALCDNIEEPIQLKVHGHSQGAALSQHFVNSLSRQMASFNSSLLKIQKVEMSVWEAPATLEEQAKEFCELMFQLSRHPLTMHFRAALRYHQVNKDDVIRCGEVRLGRFRKSYNFDCQVLTFPARNPTPLGKHCTPIHNLPEEVDAVDRIDFDCSYAQELQKKAEFLLTYAALLRNRAHIREMKKMLKSKEAILALQYLLRAKQTSDPHALNAMLKETENGSKLKKELRCQNEDIQLLQQALQIFLTELQLMETDTPRLNSIKLAYPKWFAGIKELIRQNKSLEEYLTAYLERIEAIEQILQKEGNRLALSLQDTAYSNLSTADKFVAGSLLDYVKTLTHEITGQELTTSEKVKKGLFTLGAGSIAAVGAYTVGAVIVANPVTALTAVTLAGTGAVLYNGSRYVYNKTTDYFAK